MTCLNSFLFRPRGNFLSPCGPRLYIRSEPIKRYAGLDRKNRPASATTTMTIDSSANPAQMGGVRACATYGFPWLLYCDCERSEAADERRLKTQFLSALIGVHRRPK